MLTWKKVSRENGKNQEKNELGLCRAVVVSGRGGFHIDRQSKFQKLIRLEIFDLLIFKTPVDLRKIYFMKNGYFVIFELLKFSFPKTNLNYRK